MVEQGTIDGAKVERALRPCLEPLVAAGADVIVLGCTHYPLLRSAIQKICGPRVTLVDPSDAVTRQLARILASHGLASDGPALPTRYITTGDPAELSRVLAKLGVDVEAVELADI
jgi:glutamate racemase